MISLLTTKIERPPARQALVPRPRLIEQLNEGLRSGNKLILISAPAGFGKTTLVSEWVNSMSLGAEKEKQIENRIAWLSLDVGDNDPMRFITYLIAALQSVDQEIGQAAQAMMQAPQPPPPEAYLTTLINDIAETEQSIILVLDDYHLIQSLPIHQQFGFLLEHQPSQMHLVIASREDPPLPLPQMRVRGQMVEIRQDDLRFSPDECADFLQGVMGLEISSEDVATLERRTEGWIAGLQLAALSMQGSSDQRAFVRSFAGDSRHVLDYLIEEVFERQPAEVQEFMLKTSILERLCAPLCDAVAERKDSQDALFMLERANLFVVPLDQSREWYRYHRLFAELLRQRLRTSGLYNEVQLHVRARQWYETNGFMIQAVHHALAANDWGEAGRVIGLAAPKIIQNGQLATLHGWIDALPDEHVHKSLELVTIKGWTSLMMGDIETAGVYAELAEGLLPADAPPDSRAPLTALRSSLALTQQDIANAIELSQETLELIDEQDDYFLRGMALNNMAQAHMLVGDLPAATATYREMVRLSQKAGHSPTTISALANLAALLHQGAKRR
ncbi:MAG: hypothetical protein PVG32_18015, partial [Anaerolineales bacterium]